MGCALHEQKLRSKEELYSGKDIPGAERLDGTCSGSGWFDENRGARGVILDGAELECGIYRQVQFHFRCSA
jgi:hypothetical protein